ncbi:hypothetical protein [Nonomuraea sp. LPB2021202275-12-8]|uniref:hypothetical protein n=1 Tax=Nonomuraea sp. LPB2021202275-12-8 TaxID=3120159 RepID=UPI00300C7833
MTTVHIAKPDRLRWARILAMRVCLALLLSLAIFGHVVVLLLGAVDALITARLGLPRLSYSSRRLVEVVYITWKASR